MARARDASKIVLTWTPQTGVYGQTIQRRLVGTLTWTDLLATQGSGTSTYTDTLGPGQTNEATDMPHTAYEYRIKNTNYYAPDTFTGIDSTTCKNCPTEDVTNIFGFKNETTGGGNILDFSYFDPEAEWLNANWGTTKSVTGSRSVNSQSSGSQIHLACHKCGQNVDYSVNPMSIPATENGDFSYMTDYLSIASWLPTPIAAFGGNANSNMGDITRKLNVVKTSAIGNTNFQIGVGNASLNTFYPFDGQKISNFGNSTTPPTYTIGAANLGDYNFRNVPTTLNSTHTYTGIRIGTAGNSTLDTALQNISGNSTYIAIVDTQFTQNSIASNTPYKCHMHMYRITRKSAWDYTAISSYRSRGFSVTYHASINVPITGSNDSYLITSTPHYDVNFYSEDTASNANTGRRSQPTVYLKIFTL